VAATASFELRTCQLRTASCQPQFLFPIPTILPACHRPPSSILPRPSLLGSRIPWQYLCPAPGYPLCPRASPVGVRDGRAQHCLHQIARFGLTFEVEGTQVADWHFSGPVNAVCMEFEILSDADHRHHGGCAEPSAPPKIWPFATALWYNFWKFGKTGYMACKLPLPL
jgi:hypothetical protein